MTKYGIEVNGNQHYNRDGSLAEYYKERTEYLESIGWKIHQVHFSLVYHEEFVTDLITKLKNDIKNLNIDYSIFIKDRNYLRICQKCGKHFNYDLNGNICGRCKQRQKIDEKIKLVLNSGIDFNKFGWVAKVSKLLNIGENKGGGWVKKYIPKLYKEECFHRKNTSL